MFSSEAGASKVLAAAAEVKAQLGSAAPAQAPQAPQVSTTTPAAPNVTSARTPRDDNTGDGD